MNKLTVSPPPTGWHAPKYRLRPHAVHPDIREDMLAQARCCAEGGLTLGDAADCLWEYACNIWRDVDPTDRAKIVDAALESVNNSVGFSTMFPR